MSLNGPLDKFLEDEDRKPRDSFVNLTIHHLSSSLLNDFAMFVVEPHYPAGITPARTMQKAIDEQKRKKK